MFTCFSTLVGLLDKPFMVRWVSKICATTIDELWDESKTYSKEEKEDILLTGKNAWTQKSQKGMNIGSIVHDIIAQYITSYLKGKPEKMTETDNAEVKNCLNAFLKWEEENKPTYILSEEVVADHTQKIAGTVDIVAELNGEMVLIDLKTNSVIDEKMYLQTALYKHMLEACGLFCQERYILRLDKEKGVYEYHKVPTSYQIDLEAVLHLKSIYQWKLHCDKVNTKVK
jgi:ATP-dependent exoDNAse (exonuclease V) beta subunit